MKSMITKLKSIPKVLWVGLLLIVIGLAIMIPKALGMLEFYREVQFASQHNFAAGNPSPDLLRPWMSIRYVAVAYAVPEKILFDATGIQPKREASLIAINRLNREAGLGQANGSPVLINTIREAILAYRANHVVTGLIEKKVEGWMTVQYVANSTGIPAATIFAVINVPGNGNAYKPFDLLGDEINYPGGPAALLEAVQKVVDEQGKAP